MDLTAREQEILKAVIDAYVARAVPVSSAYLSKKKKISLSPASVRGTMADLEKKGFLTHPHTSAGRIPTPEGFRYYINNLLGRKEMTKGRREEIKDRLTGAGPLWRNVMDVASQQLALMSHYAGLVLFQRFGDDIYVSGRENFLSVPEFADVGKARALMQTLEKREYLSDLLKRSVDSEGMQVFVGGEGVMKSLSDCSLVATSYTTREKVRGAVGIMGPVRMDYDKIIPLVEYTSYVIGNII